MEKIVISNHEEPLFDLCPQVSQILESYLKYTVSSSSPNQASGKIIILFEDILLVHSCHSQYFQAYHMTMNH